MNNTEQDGEAYARNTDPETSHTAANAVSGDIATKLEKIALEALRSHPHGLTSREISKITGIDPWSISPRLAPLQRKGLVAVVGKKTEGRGKPRQIWKAL